MGHHNLCGKYSGKYNKTVVTASGIVSTKGKATLEITEVGKGAYLIAEKSDDGTAFNNLAYLEGDVLRAQAQSGEGITSTYISGKHLIHQLSNKSPTVWTVKNFKLKRCKH